MLNGIACTAAILDLEVDGFAAFSSSQHLFKLFRMYQQHYNENYGQPGSYSQHQGQYGGYSSDTTGLSSSYDSQPHVVLDEYNSDLNFVIEPDGVTGSSLHKDGFEYMWAGARATHGVRSGKVKHFIEPQANHP